MTHERQIAKEIREEYVDTMSKIYYSYFKGYLTRLTKLQVRLDEIYYSYFSCYLARLAKLQVRLDEV